MKTYKSIEETIADVQKKDKRYNYIVMIVMALMAAFIVTVIVYDQQVKKQNDVILKSRVTIDQLKTKELENEFLRERDSIRTDSITGLVTTLRQELSVIKKQLAKNNRSNSEQAVVMANINLAQDKLNQITNNISDNTIVRYYKRKADGNRIEDLIQNMKNPSFRLNLKDVPNDNGRYKVNTIWFGADVNRVEVSKLIAALKKIGVRISNVKEFDNPKTKDWKKAAIEIGYAPVNSSSTKLSESEVKNLRVNNNNIKYNVRFYSYKPDQRIKNRLTTLIKKENYAIKVYPDWKKQYSFFSKVPTVFYYDKDIKDIAEKLAATLSSYVKGVTFKAQFGSGYGIKQNEKKNTFIIHYTQ
ncbi:hypothetical protein KORDIASMS9_02762 [Kordia sp. SMS9]|uniref:hypothetical protein n=1 Tax=Kordia sp. SMS9 TaxID=2282170 RepID=UPI000E0D9B73|nr:hypothetical protein [Kordia sp. SMS9]AXG70522.1 hypothetical protein KORDIASMS9_02762 [Kordia sp. SMS9]